MTREKTHARKEEGRRYKAIAEEVSKEEIVGITYLKRSKSDKEVDLRNVGDSFE